MKEIMKSIAIWLLRSVMMRWGPRIYILPFRYRALLVTLKTKPWLEKAHLMSATTNGEALPLLVQGEKIYVNIQQLGLPTPEVQFVSLKGDLEPINDSLERMRKYINIFCTLAEDSEDKRFSGALFEDSKEYLEDQCRYEKNEYMIRRIRRLTNR